MRTQLRGIASKRLIFIGTAIVGIGMAAGAIRYIARTAAPRLMERMAEDVMPQMMDACFAQMPQDRRAFMLSHCRGMLDRVDDKYAVTRSAAEPAKPVEVA